MSNQGEVGFQFVPRVQVGFGAICSRFPRGPSDGVQSAELGPKFPVNCKATTVNEVQLGSVSHQ